MALAAPITRTRPGLPLARLPLARAGVILAWVAVAIYAASNSIVALLVGIGEAAPVAGGRNAITYHNLLLLGTLISALPVAVLFRRDLTRVNLRRLTRRDWGMLTLSAFLSSALTPGLFFYALAHTSVTNVVLISRIEPPLFLLAAWLVLHERFSRRAMCAGLIAVTGAVVIVGLRGDAGLSGLGRGDWAAVAATLSYIASTLVTRAGLRGIPTGIFTLTRTLAGAAIYFALVCLIEGPEAFRDIFAPVLWNWIWVYAGIVIVAGQVAWTLALKHARAADLSLATSVSPLIAILFAMALLGEAAGPGLLPGAALILLAVVVGRGTPSRATTMANAEAEQCRSIQTCALPVWPMISPASNAPALSAPAHRPAPAAGPGNRGAPFGERGGVTRPARHWSGLVRDGPS